MVEELWQKVTKRRRNKYNDVFNQAHDIPPKSLEDQELDDNEWKLPVEPEQADRDMVEAYNFKTNPDAWEEYETKDWDWENREFKKDWRLKDEKKRAEYAERSGRVNAYDGKKNWQETRLLPREYKAREKQIQKDGLPKVWMFPQLTDGLHSIQVLFPTDFQHLTNEEGQRRKMNTKARYHISLGYEPEKGKDDYGFKQALYDFYNAHFPPLEQGENPTWDWIEKDLGKKINVSSGSTYELQDEDNDFIKWMNWIARKGTKKSWAHISLD
jgi:hypothetical protein